MPKPVKWTNKKLKVYYQMWGKGGRMEYWCHDKSGRRQAFQSTAKARAYAFANGYDGITVVPK